MKKTAVKDLTGGEILAKDIYTSSYNILMSRGSVLKKEYAEKLPLLGIHFVYIEDSKEEASDNTMENDIKQTINKKVRHVLETHIYKHNKELSDLCEVAEDIISAVLDEEQINEKVVEIKAEGGDMYTHSVNVCSLGTVLALKLKLDKEKVEDIAKGSILHDLGLRYITVPYENIDISSLPQQDQNEYKKHVTYAFKALEKENWLSQTAKDIILFHHEYINGTGYPLHLTDEKLEIPVKIVSLCDAFDQMISGIGWKQTNLQESIEYLRYNKGILFDKYVTEKFLQMIVQYPIGTIVVTNQGEIGRVVRLNREMMERPVIEIIKNSSGKILKKPEEIDLLKVLNVFIVKTIS